MGRSVLKLPLLKRCAVPFALQNRALSEGKKGGEKVPRQGQEEGRPAKGAKRKKGRVKTGQFWSMRRHHDWRLASELGAQAVANKGGVVSFIDLSKDLHLGHPHHIPKSYRSSDHRRRRNDKNSLRHYVSWEKGTTIKLWLSEMLCLCFRPTIKFQGGSPLDPLFEPPPEPLLTRPPKQLFLSSCQRLWDYEKHCSRLSAPNQASQIGSDFNLWSLKGEKFHIASKLVQNVLSDCAICKPQQNRSAEPFKSIVICDLWFKSQIATATDRHWSCDLEHSNCRAALRGLDSFYEVFWFSRA